MHLGMENSGRRRTREHISIEINHSDEELVASLRRKVESVSSLHSICRVKESLRKANPKQYIPEKVSIGPYHHGKESLKSMETHKWLYVHSLLNRKPNLEACLDDCVMALKELEHRALSCYSDNLRIGDNEFLEIMFVDGCFFIELLFKYSVKSLRRRNDPIFNTPGMLFELRSDLILLENQIPWFVLERLFQVVPIPKQCTQTLPELAFRFFKNMIPGDQRIHREKFNQEGNHLLDLICHCLLPTYPRVQSKQPKSEKHDLQPATKLQASGIKFRIGKTDNLLDIKFVNGVLEIPPIIVHQYTESLFRNLIALEQCSEDSVHYITSYVVLLKSLICNEKDAKLLKRKDILTNYDANESEIAKLFDRICQEVNLKESFYNGLCEQVSGHNGKAWHGLSKKVKRNYNKNPHQHLVLIVAVLVLLLTIVGTLFSVLAFFVHHL